MGVDRGFDNLKIGQRIRYFKRTIQNKIIWGVEDGVSGVAGVLKIHSPSLTERFLSKGSPDELFSHQETTSVGANGESIKDSRDQTRGQFVAEVIGRFEAECGMSTDKFWKQYRRGQLDSDGPQAREYVSWAGFCGIMERDIRRSLKDES